MIKEIHVAGITLGNYTTRESLMQMDKAFYEEKFTIVEEVNMRSIILAGEDAVVKNTIESVDLTVIAEAGILDAAGEHSLHRKREIEQNEFFNQFLRRIERNSKKVLLLGDREEEVALAQGFLEEEFPRMQIGGAFCLEYCKGDEDGVVNDINAEAVDVIISVLPSPRQEYFLANHKDKLSARIWYGVSEGKFVKPKASIANAFVKLFRVKKLMKYIRRYEKQKEM
jgi:N-acetylglucosaminyldiphosphoundecaprenol N-acetyl-beta-D-mannosaminyltransferase